MSLMEILLRLSKGMPSLLESKEAAKYVKKLEVNASPEGYVTLVFILSIIFSLIFFFGYIEQEWIYLPIVWAMAFVLFLWLPKLEFKRRVSEAERELPFTLRDMGMLLGLGIPFTKCLQEIGRRKNQLAKQFRIVGKEMEKGITFQKAIVQRAEYLESLEIKRGCAQLISAYEEGTKGKEIKKLGDELLALRFHRLREYAGKSALLGLVFIVVAAVLPTFFLVIVGLGETVFSSPWSKEAIAPALLVFFPLVALVIVLVAKATTPDPIFSAEGRILYTPFLAAVPLLLGTMLLQGELLYILIFLLMIGIFLLLYPVYKKDKQREEIEERLPDALLAAAGLPKGSSLEKVLETISKGEYGELSKEASISLRQLRSQIKPETVLEDFRRRNRSGLVHRTTRLMEQAFLTNKLERLNEIAEDLLKTLEIKRQRQGLLAVQKYTLLAGAVLIPLILKSASGLVENLGSLQHIDIQGTVQAIDAVLPGYMVLYALLTAYYLADLEGKSSQALLYFGGMSIVGIFLLYI